MGVAGRRDRCLGFSRLYRNSLLPTVTPPYITNNRRCRSYPDPRSHSTEDRRWNKSLPRRLTVYPIFPSADHPSTLSSLSSQECSRWLARAVHSSPFLDVPLLSDRRLRCGSNIRRCEPRAHQLLQILAMAPPAKRKASSVPEGQQLVIQ